MSQYRDLQGRKTNATDPNRMVWSSARCTFWTDDWDKLRAYNSTGIPCCPHCGSPGYESIYQSWKRSVERYDKEVREGFATFLQEMKEKCVQSMDKKPFSVKEAFEAWLKEGKNSLNVAISKLVESESK